MNEFRLLGWPELEHVTKRTAHYRVLHAMSQRHASVDELAQASGLTRPTVRRFIRELQDRGLVHVRHRAWSPATWIPPLRRRIAALDTPPPAPAAYLQHS